jgi:hypothetical protein
MTDWYYLIKIFKQEVSEGIQPTDLADAAWLAAQWGNFAADSAQTNRGKKPSLKPSVPISTADEIENVKPPESPVETPEELAPPSDNILDEASTHDDHFDVQLPNKARKNQPRIICPAPAALKEPDKLAKALRGFHQRIPSRFRVMIDERATVESIIEKNSWEPVLHYELERRFDVALVVEKSVAMGFWHNTVTELKSMLISNGIFRDVRVWSLLKQQDTGEFAILPNLTSQAKGRKPKTLTEPNGRKLILLISDCVSEAWYDGGIVKLINQWAMPVALLQMLPEKLWQRTGLSTATPIRLLPKSTHLQTISFKAVVSWMVDAEQLKDGIFLPIAILEPSPLKQLAQLITGTNNRSTPGYYLPNKPSLTDNYKKSKTLAPKERLKQFWRSASPNARQLAKLLAAAPRIRLPIIRLIREAMLKEATHIHEAEFLLSGLLEVVHNSTSSMVPDKVDYDFIPEVRGELLDAQSVTDSRKVLEKVSEYVEDHLGEATGFAAVLTNPTDNLDSIQIGQLSESFATVATSVLKRLGGRFKNLLKKIEQAKFYEEAVFDKELAQRLVGKVDNALAIYKEVMLWTGGMPIFINELCQFIRLSSPIPKGEEAESIENFIQRHVVNNWETEEPKHLKTICEHMQTLHARIINHEFAALLLERYQEILQGKFPNNNPQQLEDLQKLGLVSKRLGKLQISNKIYEAVFEQNWVNKTLEIVHIYANFLNLANPERCAILAKRLGATETATDDPNVFKLRFDDNFPVNLTNCLWYFVPANWSLPDIINHLSHDEMAFQVVIVISLNTTQQKGLRPYGKDTTTPSVVPTRSELTALLLSSNPVSTFVKLLTTQLKISYISPYQLFVGAAHTLFFGRTQILARIFNRASTNYLIMGGRGLGKSSLLNYIIRHYRNNPKVECHYLFVLSSHRLQRQLAQTLNLPKDTDLSTLLDNLANVPEGKRRLFLIDEADIFIRDEIKNGYPILSQFRKLSEKGRCNFIFAGFWDLYEAAVSDYISPLKNFGESVIVGELEYEACRELATKPMAMLGRNYTSEKLVEHIVKQTGQQAHLIAIVCNEILNKLEKGQQTVNQEDVENALQSRAVTESLFSAFGRLTENNHASHLDRVILYLTVEKGTFTFSKIRKRLDDYLINYTAEQLSQSLARLKLASIIRQEDQSYRYCVPLFRQMLMRQNLTALIRAEDVQRA